MSNSFTQIYIQAVWAVKYRNAQLDKAWRKELFAVIGNLINETGCETLIVNGVENHVHCFFKLKPAISISEVMQVVKGKSSKWLNDTNKTSSRFEWQRGYGAFSYSKSSIKNVYNYIKNQEEHHRKIEFIPEYIDILEEAEVEYNREFIFKDLE
jgi:REP element-mobilizing transposase RayT